MNNQQLAKTVSWILDLLFPVRCLGCGVLLKKDYLCRLCFKKIEINNNSKCLFCSSKTVDGKTCIFCKRSHDLDQTIVAARYDNFLIQKLIKAFKYRFVKDIGNMLGELLIKKIKKQPIDQRLLQNAVVVPVPLTKTRLNWRGFNQAEFLACFIARYLNIPLENKLLKRIKNAKPQAEVEKEERTKNIKGVFAYTDGDAVKNRVVILVDDVTTTGSTLNECAGALKKAGAIWTIGLIVADGNVVNNNKK